MIKNDLIDKAMFQIIKISKIDASVSKFQKLDDLKKSFNSLLWDLKIFTIYDSKNKLCTVEFWKDGPCLRIRSQDTENDKVIELYNKDFWEHMIKIIRFFKPGFCLEQGFWHSLFNNHRFLQRKIDIGQLHKKEKLVNIPKMSSKIAYHHKKRKQHAQQYAIFYQ